VLGFEGLEAVHQGVVLGVGEYGSVEDVVEVLVVAELVAEALDLDFWGGVGRHLVIIEKAMRKRRWPGVG